jgi:bifunctional DNase/RNase
MEKIKLEIMGLSYSKSQTGAYALILAEENGKRRLPIIIGGFEAQAIAIELEKMKPTRPLTHDLFKSFALEFNIYLSEVIIHKFVEGVFYAKIFATDGTITKEIDSRTSDAVALAIRFNCPINTYETVLKDAGILVDDEEEDEVLSTKKPVHEGELSEYEDYTIEELEDILKIAIENEEYEKASKIRDEVNKRIGK